LRVGHCTVGLLED